MQLRCGGFLHADSEVSVSIMRRANETPSGVVYSITHTWTIDGQILGDTMAEVVARYLIMESAYSLPVIDLELRDPTTGIIAHRLPTAGSVGGVRVTMPVSYPEGRGAELSTFRTYRIVAEAEYPTSAGVASLLRAFSETVTYSGGGPRRALIDLVNAKAQLQTTYLMTGFRAVQQGQAVGYRQFPPFPNPLWSVQLLLEPPQRTRGAATLRKGVYVDWPISWTYSFGSPDPLVGNPTLWPATG